MGVQPGLCGTWSETQVVVFSDSQAHFIVSYMFLHKVVMANGNIL